MSLKNVYEILEEINSTSSRIEKEQIIEKYKNEPDFERVATYALDPLKRFNITEIYHYKNHPRVFCNGDIFSRLDILSKQKGASNDDREDLSILSSDDPETVNVVNRILSKDLKCGASIKTFKKFFPIITHELMLCRGGDEEDLGKFLKLANYDPAKIFWSLKIDGVRCWFVNTDGDPIYLSRNGKEYENFGIFDEELKRLQGLIEVEFPNRNIIIDGEVVSSDKKFQKTMTQLRRLNEVDSSIFRFAVFDFVADNVVLRDRVGTLRDIFEENNFQKLYFVDHAIFSGIPCEEDPIKKYVRDYCWSSGDEGFVLKLVNSPYEFKRSKYWCKVKPVMDADVPCYGFEYGKKGSKYAKVVGKLLYEFNGIKDCKVGSGLSDEDRKEFLTNTPKLIEIEYNGLTDDGIPRFPRFKRVREDK